MSQSVQIASALQCCAHPITSPDQVVHLNAKSCELADDGFMKSVSFTHVSVMCAEGLDAIGPVLAMMVQQRENLQPTLHKVFIEFCKLLYRPFCLRGSFRALTPGMRGLWDADLRLSDDTIAPMWLRCSAWAPAHWLNHQPDAPQNTVVECIDTGFTLL